LLNTPRTWLITGVGGFIGSNLLETLLNLNQKVIGLDNFSTGYSTNLDQVKNQVQPKQWQNFKFIEGDLGKIDDCHHAAKGVDYVLHQAAIGSVPRSIIDPLYTHNSNISGFLHILLAARNAKVKRFVFASSSSVYGDNTELPKIESKIGNPLSPYALTKYVDELYAQVFARCYNIETIGLRYFNVFGRRQDPQGAYAAVIPKWVSSMIKGEDVYINGDGETSRDFCFVENVVQANLLAATTVNANAINQVYNVALNDTTTLNKLFETIRDLLVSNFPQVTKLTPRYREFRQGDIRHSQADISKITSLLNYQPTHNVYQGLRECIAWYIENLT